MVPEMGYPPDLRWGPPYLRWGTPPDLRWGTPQDLRWGTPQDLRWGTPLPGYPPITQCSIASTCYVVGGVPLAFTQEDFLVIDFFSTEFTESEFSEKISGKLCGLSTCVRIHFYSNVGKYEARLQHS